MLGKLGDTVGLGKFCLSGNVPTGVMGEAVVVEMRVFLLLFSISFTNTNQTRVSGLLLSIRNFKKMFWSVDSS
jgi:hypothetical protein